MVSLKEKYPESKIQYSVVMASCPIVVPFPLLDWLVFSPEEFELRNQVVCIKFFSVLPIRTYCSSVKRKIFYVRL